MTIGIEEWFYNFSQFFSDLNTPENLATVKRPYLEYSLWGMFKGAQISSILGGCVAHPLYRMYLKKQLTKENTTPNSHKVIRHQCRKLQGRFLLTGLVIGPSLALYNAYNMSYTELQNKCYRIRLDAEGLTYDRSTVVFGFVGWYWKRFQGAVDGINVAIAYATINNKLIAPYTNPVLVNSGNPDKLFPNVESAQAHKSKLDQFLSNLDSNEQAKQ